MSFSICGYWVQPDPYGLSHSLWIFVPRLISIAKDYSYTPKSCQHPRLVLYAILAQDKQALTLWAPDCGSWGVPARSTSQRSYINPWGQPAYSFVEKGNQMVSRILERTIELAHYLCSSWHLLHEEFREFHSKLLRMVLCIMLILSKNCYFLVEQPSQSLLYMHKRWQYLANRICWVPLPIWPYIAYCQAFYNKQRYHFLLWCLVLFSNMVLATSAFHHSKTLPAFKVRQVFFWMQLHGSPSPKRSMFMGNLRSLNKLDKGKLTCKEREKRSKIKTTRDLILECWLHQRFQHIANWSGFMGFFWSLLVHYPR